MPEATSRETDPTEEPQAGRLSAVGVVVVYLVAPPVAVLGAIYGASYLAGVSFGEVVFWLTMLLVLAWFFRTGSYQTGHATTTKHGTLYSIVDQKISHRGSTGTDSDGTDDGSISAEGGILPGYMAADVVSTNRLLVLLTAVALLGWLLVVAGVA